MDGSRAPDLEFLSGFTAMSVFLRVAVISLFLCAVLTMVSACAGFDPTITASLPPPDPDVEVTALRADSDGLLLEFRAPHAREGDELEIWRRVEGQDWQLLQTIAVDDGLDDALARGRVQWRDVLDDEPRNLLYRLRHRSSDPSPEQTRTSPPLAVAWRGWPAPPQAAATPGPSKVILSWQVDSHFSVRILRRDVLADTEFVALAIVDAAAGGLFYDTDVDAGGVYAYRLQRVDDDRHPQRFSPFSPILYVAIPD